MISRRGDLFCVSPEILNALLRVTEQEPQHILSGCRIAAAFSQGQEKRRDSKLSSWGLVFSCARKSTVMPKPHIPSRRRYLAIQSRWQNHLPVPVQHGAKEGRIMPSGDSLCFENGFGLVQRGQAESVSVFHLVSPAPFVCLVVCFPSTCLVSFERCRHLGLLQSSMLYQGFDC